MNPTTSRRIWIYKISGPDQDAGEDHPVARDASDGLPTSRRHVAIGAAVFGTMLASVDSGSLNVALPTLARDLGVDPSAAVLLVTVYQLVMIMMVLPFSALGDRIGHRRLYQGGQILYICATLLFFIADGLPALIGIRACQALGAAATFSVSSAMVRSIYPDSQLGRGMALSTIVGTITASLAPSLGGAILAYANWRWIFAMGVPFGLMSLILGRTALPQSEGRLEPFDGLAALLSALTFGAAVIGMEGAVHGTGPVISSMLIATALVIGTIFLRRESTRDNPVFPVDLLRERQVSLSALASLAASVATMLILLTLPFRLQHQYHYTPIEIGLVLAAWPLAMALSAPASGLLSDRVRAGLLGSGGTIIAVIGMATLAFLPDAPSRFDIIWRVMVTSAGFGAFASPNARQIILSAPRHRAAAAGGLSQTTKLGGQVLGSTLAASLLALGIGDGASPPLIAAGLGVIATICCLLLLGYRTGGRPRG